MKLDDYVTDQPIDYQGGLDVIVDSREALQMRKIAENLSEMGLKVDVKPLEAGDYLLLASRDKSPLIVERKTPTDFLQSLKSRLWDQLRLLKDAESDGFSVAIALVGYLPLIRKITEWNVVSVARLIDEVALSWKIPIIPCPDKEWFTSWLAAKAKDLGKGEEKRPIPMRHVKRQIGLNEKILYVLEGVVGTVSARSLLRKFHTLNAIANAREEDLKLPKLIGDKKAAEIWSVFHTEWREEVEERG